MFALHVRGAGTAAVFRSWVPGSALHSLKTLAQQACRTTCVLVTTLHPGAAPVCTSGWGSDPDQYLAAVFQTLVLFFVPIYFR